MPKKISPGRQQHRSQQIGLSTQTPAQDQMARAADGLTLFTLLSPGITATPERYQRWICRRGNLRDIQQQIAHTFKGYDRRGR